MQQQERRNAGLQALRGVAVLLVFTQHTFAFAHQVTPGPIGYLLLPNIGGIGVFMFFALSAFLMADKINAPPVQFALDRARRIYPFFWLSLAAALIVNIKLFGNYSFSWQLPLLLPFGPPVAVTGPYWTLHCELFFYILILSTAVILSRRAVLPIVVAWGIAGLIWAAPGDDAYPRGLHLLLPSFAAVFAAGMLARIGFDSTQRRHALPYAAGAVAGLLGAHLIALAPGVLTSVPATLVDLPTVLVTAGSFCAVRAAALYTADGRVGKALRALGDCSYGIYLFHMLVMVSVQTQFNMRGIHPPFWTTAAIIAVAALPPSMAFGYLDHWMQPLLKRLQMRIGGAIIGRQPPRQNSEDLAGARDIELPTVGTRTVGTRVCVVGDLQEGEAGRV